MGRGRKYTPTLLQMESVECGAAALGIILAYYRKIVPLAALRESCGVSRDGSKASNIVMAARLYGLKADGFSMSLESVREIPCPFIIFWHFNHFVVVEGFSPDRVYLNDPAVGHRTVSAEEFAQGFTGVVLRFEPSPEFRPHGREPSVIAALWRRVQGNMPVLLLIAAAGLLSVLPGLVLPTLASVYLDAMILDARLDWFRPLIMAMIATLVLKLVLQGVQQTYIRRLRLGLMVRLNSQFFWHLLHLPIKFYTQRFPGEIVNRMELNSKLARVVSGPLISTVVDLFTMLVYGSVLLLFHVPLTMCAVGFALLNLWYLRYVARQRVEANLRYSQEAGKLEGFTIAGIQSIETLKASGMESDFFAKWMGYFAKSSNASQELQHSNQLAQSIPSLVDILTTVMILIVGGYAVIHGQMTIGGLVAFQGLMTSFLAPVARLTEMGTTFQELRGDLTRLEDVLANSAADSAAKNNNQMQLSCGKVRLTGQLELKGVTFGYSPLEPPLISEFNVTVRPGEQVAIVGASGSGKSTIAKLICGLYQPWEGEILFDGKPRTQWSSEVMHLSLGMVEQQILLFEGTVRENLTLWDQSLADAPLERACDDAHLQAVIGELGGNFSARLSEGGGNLSGGQRQRLEIARALVHDPAILVLDEATSALDAETEGIIQANLQQRKCTTILIAHRLSTIRDCDEILVLEHGRVVEQGTHEQLWKLGGVYTRLLQPENEPESHADQVPNPRGNSA
jgi:NHLM bacteriocin system ABC transporter peptidase/ATP-binding protein